MNSKTNIQEWKVIRKEFKDNCNHTHRLNPLSVEDERREECTSNECVFQPPSLSELKEEEE